MRDVALLPLTAVEKSTALVSLSAQVRRWGGRRGGAVGGAEMRQLRGKEQQPARAFEATVRPAVREGGRDGLRG